MSEQERRNETRKIAEELKQKTSSESWSQGKRVRVEISMTAKGLCQPSATIELLNQEIVTVKNPNDVGDIKNQTIAQALYALFDDIEIESDKRNIKVVWKA